jgi:MFS family permease
MLMKIPRTVWALGLVSLFMDLSSEIIHALLPVFLTTTLGASVALVGLIDGVGESAASITKVFSGYISDRLGRRKPLILLGYGLGALSKPFFAIATGPIPVLGARFADRIGKGLRGAPRDALVADVTPVKIRGRAYGLRQARVATCWRMGVGACARPSPRGRKETWRQQDRRSSSATAIHY